MGSGWPHWVLEVREGDSAFLIIKRFFGRKHKFCVHGCEVTSTAMIGRVLLLLAPLIIAVEVRFDGPVTVAILQDSADSKASRRIPTAKCVDAQGEELQDAEMSVDTSAITRVRFGWGDYEAPGE
jgi:hypothetical protein